VLQKKKRAYQQRDALGEREAARLSRQVHDYNAVSLQEPVGESDFIKSFVFGGLDGCLTAFAVVSAAEGAALKPRTILVLGLANVFADALAMATGDWVSEKAEADYAAGEFDRERWEFENYPAGEIAEMKTILTEKYGVSSGDADELLRLLSNYKHLFLETMAHFELGILPPCDHATAYRKGKTTFFAFLICGSAPLLAYVLCIPLKLKHMFLVSIFATALTLFSLGLAQASIVKDKKVPLRGALLILMNGALAAAAAYIISWAANTALLAMEEQQNSAHAASPL